MDKVQFTFRNGRSKMLTVRQAEILTRQNLGTYQTRDMSRQPMVTTPMVAEDMSKIDLSKLDKDQLHALAKARGIKVHHLAGADKVRAALEAAQ